MEAPPEQETIADLLMGDGEQMATTSLAISDAWREYEQLVQRLAMICDELAGWLSRDTAWQAGSDDIRFGRTRATVQHNVGLMTRVVQAQRQKGAILLGLIEALETNADDLLVNSIASHMARRPVYADLPGGRATPSVSLRNATLGDLATLGEDGYDTPVAGQNVLQTSSMQDATVYYSETL